MKCELGRYGLTFARDGKLQNLVFDGRYPLLHESNYAMDLKDGRAFIVQGWDECFPTIDASGSSGLMGEIIGGIPQITDGKNEIRLAWRTSRFTTQKVFRLNDINALELIFSVRNVSNESFPFLWASHALFSLTDLVEISLSNGIVLNDFSLDGTCRKFFIQAGHPVTLRKKDVLFGLETDQPYWGIWFNRGGWPENSPAGFGCIGIEATNSPSEIPTGDIKLGAQEVFQGGVTISIISHASAA